MDVSQLPFNISEGFPALITPRNLLSKDEFFEYLKSSKMLLYKAQLKYGALLFRNFPLNSAHDFSTFITILNYGKFVNYIGGDSPRDKVAEGIYTSTEAPPS